MGEKYSQHFGRAQACYDASEALRELMVNTEPLDTDQVEDGITKAFQALEGMAWMSRIPEEHVLAFGILVGTQLLENILKISLRAICEIHGEDFCDAQVPRGVHLALSNFAGQETYEFYDTFDIQINGAIGDFARIAELQGHGVNFDFYHAGMDEEVTRLWKLFVKKRCNYRYYRWAALNRKLYPQVLEILKEARDTYGQLAWEDSVKRVITLLQREVRGPGFLNRFERDSGDDSSFNRMYWGSSSEEEEDDEDEEEDEEEESNEEAGSD